MSDVVQHPIAWLRHHIFDDTTATLVVLLSLVGAYACLSYPLSLLRILFNFTPFASPFATSLASLRHSRTQHTPWAVITGATGGIGKEFTLQLANSGFSLLLVARSQSKLNELVQHVTQVTKLPLTSIKTVVIDFANSTDEDWTRFQNVIDHDLRGGSVKILINNAGLSHSSPTLFSNTPTHEIDHIPMVNVTSTLHITKCVVSHMLRHRERSLILNVGSFSALVPTPMLATYAGSKGFLYTWSQALGAELKEQGVTVRLLNTYFVASEMSKIKKPTWMIPSPKTYVASVLSSLGLAGGAVGKAYISTPYLPHALVQWVVDTFGSEQFWLSYNLKMQQGIAQRVEKRRLRLLAAGEKVKSS